MRMLPIIQVINPYHSLQKEEIAVVLLKFRQIQHYLKWLILKEEIDFSLLLSEVIGDSISFPGQLLVHI